MTHFLLAAAGFGLGFLAASLVRRGGDDSAAGAALVVDAAERLLAMKRTAPPSPDAEVAPAGVLFDAATVDKLAAAVATYRELAASREPG